jgi:hypothetical protein
VKVFAQRELFQERQDSIEFSLLPQLLLRGKKVKQRRSDKLPRDTKQRWQDLTEKAFNRSKGKVSRGQNSSSQDTTSTFKEDQIQLLGRAQSRVKQSG